VLHFEEKSPPSGLRIPLNIPISGFFISGIAVIPFGEPDKVEDVAVI
jgi:hypothetical protein